MKRKLPLLLTIVMCLTFAVIAAPVYRPARTGAYYSSDGTGHDGTWLPMAGTGGTGTPVGRVQAAGLYYSSDGTGHDGTWLPCGASCFGGGTFNALSGDAVSTSTGGATTVIGINGTLLSGLATGLLKNTTATGVPSIAVAGTDYAGVSNANTFTAASQTMTNGAGGIALNVVTTQNNPAAWAQLIFKSANSSSGTGVDYQQNNVDKWFVGNYGSTNYVVRDDVSGLLLLDFPSNVMPAESYSGNATGPKLGGIVTFGTLYSAAGTAIPACTSGLNGAVATVTDATAPTYRGAYTSGGTITTLVQCNGATTAWLTH